MSEKSDVFNGKDVLILTTIFINILSTMKCVNHDKKRQQKFIVMVL